jgi:hypothetical protein
LLEQWGRDEIEREREEEEEGRTGSSQFQVQVHAGRTQLEWLACEAKGERRRPVQMAALLLSPTSRRLKRGLLAFAETDRE